ncbi:hypothetical protein OH809_40435 [Streptomyces sp. NBC_00873]|uniref:hypothetical protein n=1 Tax=unclassified Streptomyces TaxID=2593676 RepID=UPI00386BEFD9|nr:hypothetical protein OH809_40435 [Streptomyces sp. NBC_00873]WTA41799.1 hypothetical protein OH821_03265 [Streptomyces sp. NBC_00842]
MNNGLKITVFAAALAATFGTAYGVGKGVDPLVSTGAHAPQQHSGHGATGRDGAAEHGPGGLQISEDGYTLALDTPAVAAGGRTGIRFAIEDDAGRKVTAFRREHGKELHFILASRDLTEYRHLHPVRAADGTWSTSVDLPKAGDYRAFADFTPAAEGAKNVTLGADLPVSGAYRPAALPAARSTTEVEGYRVALGGELRAGRESELELTISRNGEPVTDLQPYLGAYGHLVALRSGDLAYLHVHPNDGGPGPAVSFTATAPSAGMYRLFLDFQHEGKVRTAAFTVEVKPSVRARTEASSGHQH